MNSAYLFIAGFSVFLGIFTVASLAFLPSYGATMQRVHEVTKSQSRSIRGLRRLSLTQIIGQFAIWLRAHLQFLERPGLAQRFEQAGLRTALSFDLYTTSRAFIPLLGLLLAACIPNQRFFWMIVGPALAYLLPDVVLSALIRRRTTLIRKSMPDTIDLLVICVDAGLGLDQAMLRVAGELRLSHPQMHDELVLINREQRAGKPRTAAWQAMVERVRIPETEALVNMLIQTERFGTPIARALRTYAAGARMQRTRNAEEQAAKTTIKIIFPLVLFIFPSLFIVLLGPAAISILHGFGPGF